MLFVIMTVERVFSGEYLVAMLALVRTPMLKHSSEMSFECPLQETGAAFKTLGSLARPIAR